MKHHKMPSHWDYFAKTSFKPNAELEQLEDAMMDELMAVDEKSTQEKQSIYLELGLDISDLK